jgi:hypothetical protein
MLLKEILSTLPVATEEIFRVLSKYVLETGNYEYYGIIIVIILVIPKEKYQNENI